MRLQNGTLCRVCSHLRSVAATLRLACLEGREEKRNICCPIILLFLSLLLFFLKVRQIKTVETDEEQAAGTDENANKVVQFRCVHPGLGVYYVIVVQSFGILRYIVLGCTVWMQEVFRLPISNVFSPQCGLQGAVSRSMAM